MRSGELPVTGHFPEIMLQAVEAVSIAKCRAGGASFKYV
ncbi:hypothetical protein BJ928_104556 [Rhizobium sp. WW_1]|nr:hypothetical protein BJ928_104556 [Rhizobium sp. WW_1]